MLAFPLDALGPICSALGKRHPRPEEQVQFTRVNWWTIRDDVARFEGLGVRVWLPPLGPGPGGLRSADE
ncbi:hypothetical protein [Spirilliplanes yamanashiensis]|uniref:Uncharacterized protein n=1 Tax=Spirilliplanes yamanashiensis TaxID=42233 RepID=A0A8J3YEM1_9ACTN|nr:hypothetical protein [Spirilliplanes yamanashiensis]MDP9815213.1 hypothetical protein [Spirilliplanes yamanashiensis]GIJ06519.1 hypothetical protein Sya03_58710 [Spirilliplanes yamanashiensis]